MKKRLWTIVFAIAMALSLVTVTALAADEGIAGDGETYVAQIGAQKYETLAAAVADVPTSGVETTITLTGDIVMTTADIVTIGAGQNIVLDMAKHSITVDKDDFSGRPIVNNGTLTITGEGTIDSSMAADGRGSVNNYGELTIENGTFQGNLQNGYANVWNAGTAYFKNGTYDTSALAIGTTAGSTTTISGGTYKSSWSPTIENRGKMTITGGEFENRSCSSCDKDHWGYTIRSGYDTANAYLEINGSAADSVQVTGVQGGVAVIDGSAKIYNGVFKTVACATHGASAAFYPLYVAGESGEVVCEVYGGTYTAAYREAIWVGNSGSDGGAGKTAVLQVYGGSFTGGEGVTEAVKVDEEVGGLRVEGGDFSSDVSEYVPDDYAQGADGVVGPLGAENATAQVGDDYFKTLAAAIEAAGDGQTVKLLRDASVDSIIEINQNLTLNLNGHTITNNVTGERPFHVTEAVTFTVDGTAGGGMTIPESNTDSFGFIKIIAPATVTLNGGTYTGVTDKGAFIKPFNRAEVGNASGCTVNLNDVTATTNMWVISTDTLSTMTLNVTGGSYTSTAKVTDSNSTYSVFGLDCTALDAPFTFNQVTVKSQGGACIEGGGGTSTFTDCNFSVESTSTPGFTASAVAVSYKGTANIYSGTYGSAGYGAYVYSSGGTINIMGGTVSGGTAAVRSDVDEATYGNPATVNISGGTITGALQTNEDAKATISVSGGTFSSAVPMEYCAPGFEPATVDGKYTVQLDPKEDFVAQVKNEAGQITGAYETLADALTDAKSGDTIVLLANADLNTDIVISGNITIDGQDQYTIEMEPVSHAITVSANAALTLNHVTLKITGESGYGIDVRYDGALTLNHSTLDISGVSNATISAETDGASNSEPGKFTLTNGSTIIASNIGGNFSNGGTWSLEDGSKIDINGCTSHGLSCDSITVDRSTVEISGTGLLGLTAREVELVNGGQVTVENCGKELPKDSQWSTDKDGYKYPVEIKQGGTVTVDETSSFELTNNTNGNDTIYLVEATLDNDGVVKAEVVTKAPAGSVAIIVIDRGNTLSSETITTGQYTLPAAPTRPGYVFDGWQSDDGTIYDAGDSVKIEKNTTFTAQWSVYVAPNPSYLVSVNQTEGGSVTANPTAAKKGDTVTLTVTPEDGYELADLTVTDFWGRDVALTENGDGTYTFTMPGSQVEVEATFTQAEKPELPFTDVTEADWFYDEVYYVWANGLMIGDSDTTFGPNGTTTRAMVWTILARMDGETITGSTWVEDARAWAMANGVSDGTGADDAVTREQLVTMIWRYVGEPQGTGDLSGFADADTVSGWAEEAMSWSVGTGLIQGDENGLTPTATAIRAQIAAILMRFCENVAK